MTTPTYKQTLDQLRQRYQDLREQRRALKTEMIGLIKTIEGLSALCGEAPGIVPPEEEMAAKATTIMAESWLKYMPFVDAIRTALRMIYPNAFTTSELRELLKRAGYPIEAKTDPMVALNVALKRFVDAGEAEVTAKGQWRKAYKWAFKNEMTPPPVLGKTIDWEALVQEADRTADEISEQHPLRGAFTPPQGFVPMNTPADVPRAPRPPNWPKKK